MKTLFLNPKTWDLALDTNGNIAVAHDSYALAQTVANECRLFKKDLYFNQEAGIPYLTDILGKTSYSLALYRRQLTDAALSVDGVETALVELGVSDNRVVTGRITITDKQNTKIVLTL